MKNLWFSFPQILALTLLFILSGCSGSKQESSVSPAVSVKPVAVNATPEEIATAVNSAAAILGKSSCTDNDYLQVVDLLGKYESLPQSPVDLYEYLGEANLYLARFEKAEQVLASGLQRDLYSRKIRDLLSNLNYVRGRLTLEQKSPEGSEKFFANALFYAPEDSMLSHNIATRYKDRAIQAFNDKEWELCSSLIQEAVKLNVNSEENYQYLARAYFEQNKSLEALEASDRYLAVDDQNVDVLIVKGKALQQLDRVAEAHRVFRKVEAIEPGNVDVSMAIRNLSTREEHIHWFTALQYIDDGNLQDAQSELELALKEVNPGDVHRQQEIYERLSFVSIELNDYQRALMYVDNALSLAPDDINLNLEKGKILRLSQRLAEAKKVFEMLLVRFPENPDVKLATADFYLQLKLPGNAIPHLENLVNSADEQLPRKTLLKALTILGGCYALQKQYDKAEKAWQVLSEMEPDNARVLFNLGLLYQNQHQYGKAVGYYEKACSSVSLYEPNLARYLYGLAFALRQNGQSSLYVDVLQKLVEICPVDNGYRRRAYKSLIATGWTPPWKVAFPQTSSGAALFVHRGCQYLEDGELDKALEMFLQVLSFEPAPADAVKLKALDSVALIHFTRGSYARAAAFYMEATRVDPEDGMACLGLGRSFEQLTLYADAQEAYGKAARYLKGSYAQQAVLQMSDSMYAQKKYDDAIKSLDMLINDTPDSLLSSFAEKRIKDSEKVLFNVAEDETEIDKGRSLRTKARIIGSVAEALAEAGNGKEAREYIERARRLVGNDREILLIEAHLQSVEGNNEQALSLLNQASVGSPDDSRILMLKSRIYFGMNEMAKAREVLEKIVKVDSSHFEAVAALADVYQAEGRFSEARELLEALLSQSVSDDDKEKAREKLKMFGVR